MNPKEAQKIGPNARRPPQHQEKQPGVENRMTPRPKSEMKEYRGSGKLQDKAAIITGGDSGIGRAIAIGFAKEGANVAVLYLNEHEDADKTRELVEREGKRCILIAGDVGDSEFCRDAVEQSVRELGRLDILVNNAAEQHVAESLEEITDEQILRTFQTNIFAHFYLARAALKHMKEGSAIICTTSITAYEGNERLIDYASTKGAIVAFVRSMANSLAKKNIRVNGVAPGPIWTPLIPATFPPEHVAEFGADTPFGRAGEPDEVAPCYIFLASGDASYITGQIIHVNGGRFMTS